MTDIPNRDKLERKLARILGDVNKAHMARLIELLGDPPDITRVPPTFWEQAGEELRQALTPFLEQVYLDQAAELMAATPSAIDWALVNEAAVQWAQAYSFEFVPGITSTSQRVLQTAVSAYFDQGLTIGDLTQRIESIFGSRRAEMIAVTEITRAASEGEQQIVRELAKQGINLKPIWQTNNDDLVCPLCGPRHNNEITDNQYPPLHPKCRCWVNHEIIE